MRPVKQKDFAGKTIASLDLSCSNVITFYFQDGTKFEMYAECSWGSTPFFCSYEGSDEPFDEDEEDDAYEDTEEGEGWE